MRPEYNITEYLRRSLPHHKRQPNRLALFMWPLQEIATLWASFSAWRREMIYESNITGQKLSLIDLLNRRLNNGVPGITITEKQEASTYASLEAEASDYIDAGLEAESEAGKLIGLQGENLTDIDVDFRVYVPAAVNIDQARAIIERYCIAGYDYDIVYSAAFSPEDFNEDYN